MPMPTSQQIGGLGGFSSDQCEIRDETEISPTVVPETVKEDFNENNEDKHVRAP